MKILKAKSLTLPAGKYKLKARDGQSLMEVIVGLAIGSVLIGTATLGIAFSLKSSTATQNYQAGSQMAKELYDKVRSFGSADWQNIYGLTKGTSTQYFLNASSTALFSIWGQEGVLDSDITSGLVGYWKFDEDPTTTSTITYDSTGNNNNGTLTNSPTRASSTCEISNCLSLNGSSYILVNYPASGILDPTSQYSLSVWVKYTITTSYGFIVSKSNGGAGGGYELFRNSGNGTIRFSSCDASGNCGGGYFDITTPLSYNDGNWHFVVATAKTNDTANIYVDGVLVKQSSTITQNNIANSYNLFIGARGASGGLPFAGSVDDPRIYNRALSATEVKNLYNSNIFKRYFSVENVCRSNDSSSTITGVGSCAGGSINDPSTQKITVISEWTGTNTNPQVKLVNYFTRWQNRVFNQTDWMGGAGQDGPFTSPGNQYASGTNIDNSSVPGSIKILNLTPP